MNFFANKSLLLVRLGIFASNVFVLCFFYEKHIRDFWKWREKLFLHKRPNMGRGGQYIVYDNDCNMVNWQVFYLRAFNRLHLADEFRIAQEQARVAQDEIMNRFRRACEFRNAQEQARVAQGDIITAPGVSISIALTEGGGV